VTAIAADAMAGITRLGGGVFDLVYADPPYDYERYDDLLTAIDANLPLADDPVVAIEHRATASRSPPRPNAFVSLAAPNTARSGSASSHEPRDHPQELQEMIANGEVAQLIDVREPWEAEICTIAGSHLIPMGTLPQRLGEIVRSQPVAIYCHHGQRSLTCAQYLAEQGYEATSVAGGIDAWAQTIQPGMKRY